MPPHQTVGNSATRTKVVRLIPFAAPLLLSVLLAACQEGVFHPAAPGQNASEKYPITVAPQEETLSLAPETITAGLGDANAVRIGTFASNYMRHGHGPLIIESASAKISKQTFEQIKAINAILAERGVPVARLEWRTAKSAASPDKAATEPVAPLVMRYTRYTASSPDCRNWFRDAGSGHDNLPTENFGCATQNNLAASVADPLDLKRPRDTDPADPVRRGTVLGGYREGRGTAAPRSRDESGISSTIAR